MVADPSKVDLAPVPDPTPEKHPDPTGLGSATLQKNTIQGMGKGLPLI